MNNNKNITVIDWLQIRFKVELPTFSNKEYFIFNNDCFIKFTNNESQNFANVDDLYIYSNKVATVQYNPRSGILDSAMVIVKLENELFYNNTFVTYIDYLIHTLKWQYEGVSRIDIAHDSINNNVLNFLDSYLIGNRQNIKHNSKANIHTQINKYKDVKPFYCGSIKADKFCKVYDKTKEMEVNNKRYIKSFYRLNNIDYKNNKVERFELTLKNKKAKNINIYLLTNKDYLNKILHTECQKFFQFTKEVIRKNKKKTLDVTPLKFENNAEIEYNKVVQKKSITINPIHSTKRSIKYLYLKNKEQLNSRNLDVETVIRQLVKENDLTGWYEQKRKYWDLEAEKKTAFNIINKLNNKKNVALAT